MKELYINKIHLNNFKKYVLKKEQENNLLKFSKKQKNLKNKINIKTKVLSNNSSENNIIDEKKINVNNNSRNIFNKEINPKYNFREYFIKLSKKNRTLIHKSETVQQNENNRSFLLSSFNKKHFNINNIINLSLSKLLHNKEYKKILEKRINPYFYKKENSSINLDLRKELIKNRIISNNKRFLTPKYIIRKNIELNNKKEIGSQNFFSCENLTNIIKDKNIDKKNNNFNKNNLLKRCKSSIDKIKKKIFNKFEKKNKSFIKNYSLYSRINNKYEKIQKQLKIQNNINSKILNKLKLEQNMSDINLKLGLVKLEGYEKRRNKKINNNSYNIFL